jgi:hypothetical protein
MTVDDTTIWRINTDSMNGIIVEGTRGTGFEALATPADAIVRYPGSPDFRYWDGIEALFGYRDGVTYIRFRNGDDPNGKNVRSSPGPVRESSMPAGAGVLLSDKSFVIVVFDPAPGNGLAIGSRHPRQHHRGQYSHQRE